MPPPHPLRLTRLDAGRRSPSLELHGSLVRVDASDDEDHAKPVFPDGAKSRAEVKAAPRHAQDAAPVLVDLRRGDGQRPYRKEGGAANAEGAQLLPRPPWR